jgi:hypothetical protein
MSMERNEFVPSMTMTVDDGSVLRTQPTVIETEAAIEWSPLIAGNLDGFHVAVDGMAQSYADGLAGAFYEHLSSVTEITGQVVDRQGRDHWVSLLEALDRVEWIADDDGSVRLPTLHINPLDAPKFANPPDWVEGALTSLSQRKQEEWNARRRHRRLPR